MAIKYLCLGVYSYFYAHTYAFKAPPNHKQQQNNSKVKRCEFTMDPRRYKRRTYNAYILT